MNTARAERPVRPVRPAPIAVLVFAVCILNCFGLVPGAECAEQKKIHEVVITFQPQRTPRDCGQTVLDMLGYNGHMMYPRAKVKVDDFRGLRGARELSNEPGREEDVDYNYPKVWFVQGKGVVAGKLLWVIRHKDTIYSPSLGVMNVSAFKEDVVVSILYIFEIPVQGQLTPEQYYQQLSQDSLKGSGAGSASNVTPGTVKMRDWKGIFPDVETDVHL